MHLRPLPFAAAAWCSVAVCGQLIFAAYVLGFYGRAALQGRPQDWNRVLPQGYVPGATLTNALLALHLLFTVVVVLGGALQLLPQLRRRAPVFHRWNGRVYVVSAMLLALGGIVMVLTRGTVGGTAQHAAVVINGVLVLLCAGQAWRLARARRFEQHRRWALRLFIVVSGVWFFRIGLMAWVVLNQGPVGFDPQTFRGPFLTFLSFAQYGLPLAVLELYFRAEQQPGAPARLAMAAGLATLTLLTALGIACASVIMWLPRL